MFLEKFEIKVNEIKKSLGEKKLSVIFFCIFGITVLMCLQMANVYGRSRQTNSDSYNRVFYNMVSNIKNAEIFVEKARVTSGKKQQITTMVQILNQINLAKEAIGNMPINQDNMNNISKFLTQTGDFCNSMIKKLATDELNEKDYEILKNINKSLLIVSQKLDDIYIQLEEGRINWDEVQKLANEELETQDNILLNGVADMKNEFIKYEGLIYDGAYSSHIEGIKPRLVENMPRVTLAEAKQKAINIVQIRNGNGEKIQSDSVKFNGKIEGKISLYSFDISLKENKRTVNVQITEKGGLLYLMIYDRQVTNPTIDDEKAKEIGKKYLQDIGIKNVAPTYTIEQNGMITINYAYQDEGVIVYTDLIKVKIAMDNGEICSVECKGYIFNNHIRENLIPAISLEQAKSKINDTINVTSSDIAIIPNELNEEILTYEFKGVIEKREYIVYINAITGEEEQVLVILDTKGGKLTM